MQGFNDKFLQYAKNLREKAFVDLDGILILHNNALYCYVNGQSIGEGKIMDLAKYDIYKTLAHSIVYYSEKHNHLYNNINEMCPHIKEQFECTDLLNLTIPELMPLASEEYLSVLHQKVQEWKSEIFKGSWPNKLVIVVTGPTSPRFGHPAMQYFSRLTKNPLETNSELLKRHVNYEPSEMIDGERKLYYVENVNDLDRSIEIALSLYVEETIFVRYQNMKTDILAENSQTYLRDKCGH